MIAIEREINRKLFWGSCLNLRITAFYFCTDVLLIGEMRIISYFQLIIDTSLKALTVFTLISKC